jgi:polyhydroxybutyrate depolymerase
MAVKRYGLLLFASLSEVAGCSRVTLDATSPEPAKDGSVDSSAPSDSSAPMLACPSPALAAGDTAETVQVGSAGRSFVLHVPSTYDGRKPAPLIVEFHAQGGSGSLERMGSPYPTHTDPEGIVMAFATGLAGPSGTAWNIGPCCVANVDDIAYARKLVAQVQTKACIDTRRVYAVGVGLGGAMAYHAACHAADVFAAVASTGFDLLRENEADCKPSRPITVISFRGSDDARVPYEGGPASLASGMPITLLGAQATFRKWAQVNQCTDSPSAEDSNDCSTYSACQGGVEVLLCTKPGDGQAANNPGVSWSVLKRHTL